MTFWFLQFPSKNKRKQVSLQCIVVRLNSFVLFLEETSTWKNHFDFIWPLLQIKLGFIKNQLANQIHRFKKMSEKCKSREMETGKRSTTFNCFQFTIFISVLICIFIWKKGMEIGHIYRLVTTVFSHIVSAHE